MCVCVVENKKKEYKKKEMYKTNEILINMLWTFAVCLLFGCPCGNLLSLVLCRRPSRCGPNQIEYAMNCKTQKFCIKRKKKTTKIHQQHQPLSYSANGQPEKKAKKNVRTFFSAYYVIFHIFQQLTTSQSTHATTASTFSVPASSFT